MPLSQCMLMTGNSFEQTRFAMKLFVTQNFVRNYIVNNRLKFQMQSETCFNLRTIGRNYFKALISMQCFVLIVRYKSKTLDQSFCRLLFHAVKSSRSLTISGFIYLFVTDCRMINHPTVCRLLFHDVKSSNSSTSVALSICF